MIRPCCFVCVFYDTSLLFCLCVFYDTSLLFCLCVFYDTSLHKQNNKDV